MAPLETRRFDVRLLAARVLGLAFVYLATPLEAQINARLLRQPDVSETHIAFVYAGDIWLVEKSGGLARRLSSPPGEESFPRFSPDGNRIAYDANYDGNLDIYVIPTTGGAPLRLTHHPAPDRVLDWTPDGESILYASPMQSAVQRYRQLCRVSAHGGLPTRLPVPYGEFAALSPDGKQLVYTPQSRDFSTWKRYRGGLAPDIWRFDLETYESENLTRHPASDAQPMWHGRTIYFLSDRGVEQRHNIWAYELDAGTMRQVTHFRDFDVHFPSIGPSDLVFEAGGSLHLMDLETEQHQSVEIRVVTDQVTLRPRTVSVASFIENVSVSPNGKRVAFEARGEIFTVPEEHGVIRNLTRSSGIAERYPAWSPDGRDLAYWSDRSGEYELTIRAENGAGGEEPLTRLGAGYRYRPHWSPDSRKLAFIDETRTIRIYDRDTKNTVVVDQGGTRAHGELESFVASWSPDSRWLAYDLELTNSNHAVYLFDVEKNRTHQVTSGFFSDFRPIFDPEGRYLYFYSNRNFDPIYSDLQNSWIYANTTNVVAAALRDDVRSPLAPRNDEEVARESDGKRGETDDNESKGAQDSETSAKRVEIHIENFERRLTVLPIPAGNFGALQATQGKVVYLKGPRTGADSRESSLAYYDLADREEKAVVANIDFYTLAANGDRVLVERNGRFAMIDLKEGQSFEGELRTAELEMLVDPAAEWQQLFTDAWRFQRDFFYDEKMHGVDWALARDRYQTMLQDAVTRWDVNYVIGELISELNASHTYRGGGDTETPLSRGVGLLGVDWALDQGRYRIANIVEGAAWDEARSPLRQPGVDVSVGAYVLAVNGVELDVNKDPWAAFQGLAERTVTLTVNDRPDFENAREVLIETLASEDELRYRSWVESNRRTVDGATEGRVGYIHVPNTGERGHNEMMRQFVAQTNRQGLIIDERFNSGGYLPDRLIELLDRRVLNFQAHRHGADRKWPRVAHSGPKVMLINGWAGSGGDAFPEYFRKAELGPLIGTRTWGGRIGLTGSPQLIDGGRATVPTYRNYDPGGDWFAEGHGVEPDIEVPEDPTQLARGTDPQLQRAIEEVMQLLERVPPVQPGRPRWEDRSHPTPRADQARSRDHRQQH